MEEHTVRPPNWLGWLSHFDVDISCAAQDGIDIGGGYSQHMTNTVVQQCMQTDR